ncbi:MAG: purine-binding chemotaxis protein CheW [Psychrobacter glaciei]|jgi:purine-binding chemotaxis protein CheW
MPNLKIPVRSLWHALGVLMKDALTVTSVSEKEASVDSVVQEYMDTLLGDLFPPVEEVEAEVVAQVEIKERVTEPDANTAIEKNPMDRPLSFQKKVAPQQTSFRQPEPRSEDFIAPIIVTKEAIVAPKVLPVSKTPAPVIEIPVVTTIPDVLPSILTDNSVKTDTIIKPEPEIEKRFPKAPLWAQEAFDVLLFDVCGLKLAVPMESLGKIIKVEHDTNQLIGRPDWFIGAYNESEEHLYVVDTAKYIMPEKGYDLEKEGFAFLIQLQRSKWTLACKQVYSTVRIEPDQVKWRSNNGKRQWLSGTVIEHMCALIHVDNLVDILNSDS